MDQISLSLAYFFLILIFITNQFLFMVAPGIQQKLGGLYPTVYHPLFIIPIGRQDWGSQVPRGWYLSRCGSPSLFQPVAEVFKVPGQVTALFLHLG